MSSFEYKSKRKNTIFNKTNIKSLEKGQIPYMVLTFNDFSNDCEEKLKNVMLHIDKEPEQNTYVSSDIEDRNSDDFSFIYQKTGKIEDFSNIIFDLLTIKGIH